MSMQDFMRDLMRTRNASEVRIVHDASMSSIPDEDPLLGSSSHHHHHHGHDDDCDLLRRRSVCSLSSSSSSAGILLVGTPMFVVDVDDDDVDLRRESGHTSRSSVVGSHHHHSARLAGFRERHRKLKETLSPVKVYRFSSPSSGEGRCSAAVVSQTTPLSGVDDDDDDACSGGRRDDLRSRLIRLASDSRIAPGLVADAV